MNSRLLFAGVTLALSGKLCAWSGKGHIIVAQIAKHYMHKNVVDSVRKYLGKMSFEDAAVWMDDIKSDAKYKYMSSWHYVNIEKDKTYVKTDKPDVINQLQLAIEHLTKTKESAEKTNLDIKLVFHLCGDIHQPLHVGYGSDRGGNEVRLMYGDNDTNLHKIWDTEIIEAGKITADACLKLAEELKDTQIKKLQIIDVPYWSYESRAYLDQVYDFKDEIIDKAYIRKNVPVVREQLIKAGIRMAAIFNKAFGG